MHLTICRPLRTSFSDTNASIVNWGQDDKHGGIRLKHFKVKKIRFVISTSQLRHMSHGFESAL